MTQSLFAEVTRKSQEKRAALVAKGASRKIAEIREGSRVDAERDEGAITGPDSIEQK